MFTDRTATKQVISTSLEAAPPWNFTSNHVKNLCVYRDPWMDFAVITCDWVLGVTSWMQSTDHVGSSVAVCEILGATLGQVIARKRARLCVG